jgi:hypothetical protein
MLEYAGFATVVIVGERVLNEVVNACHAAGTMPVRLEESGSFSITDPGLGTGLHYDLSFQFDLFCGVPVIQLRRVDAGAIRVALTFIGSIALSCDPAPIPGWGVAQSTARFRTEVRARPAVAMRDTGLVVGLDFSEVEVESLSLHVVEGEPLDDLARAILGSDEYDRTILEVFEAWLRQIGPQETTITPRILNQVADLGYALENPTYRVMDYRLAVAADIEGMTAGSQMWIQDFSAQHDVAVSVHPEVALAALEALKEDVVGTYEDYTIDSFNYELGSDYIHVWGEATERTIDVITVDYSIKARPELRGDQIAFEVFESDVDMPWWAYLLGLAVGLFAIWGLAPLVMFLTAAITISLAAVLEHIAHFIEDQAEASVEGGMEESRTQRFELPGAPGVLATLKVKELLMGSGGQRLRSDFEVQAPRELRIEVPRRIYAADRQALTCRLENAEGIYHSEDPDVKVRWQVIADSLDGVPRILVEKIRQVSEPGALEVTLVTDPLDAQYRVSAAVMHHLADGRTVGRSAKARIENYDRLDRRHPYVWWDHEIIVPHHASISPTGRIVRMDAHRTTRTSAIHRTDFEGRCRYAHKYSDKAKGRLHYLDELPFPMEELDANRDLVCDYCFYGGPDKTVPKDH